MMCRDELTERRRKMVTKAFNILDRNGSGHINLQDVSNYSFQLITKS